MPRQAPDARGDGRRLPWILLAWLALFGVTALSLGPAPPLPPQAPGFSDKLAHVGMYAALAVLFMKAYPGARPLVIGVALAGVGGGIEQLQGLTSYRSASLADALANICGIMLAIGARVARRRRLALSSQVTEKIHGSEPDHR